MRISIWIERGDFGVEKINRMSETAFLHGVERNSDKHPDGNFFAAYDDGSGVKMLSF